MLIRKKYKFEGSHVVRGCSSKRCSQNIHGHSYVVEILLESKNLDNGDMVMDFGLMKNTFKAIVDMFDHTHVLCSKHAIESNYEEINFIKKWNPRWIELPITPSVEGLSVVFFYLADHILRNTEFVNGEQNIEIHSVIMHGTQTGYAQCFISDMLHIADWQMQDIYVSAEILDEMPQDLRNCLQYNERIYNPKIV
jgi:6-pyruvoyltetrahydropterin/6-carboxytetrahydropterin synthase